MPINVNVLENIRGNNGAHDTIWQLFRNGPTSDGNMVSKTHRDQLVTMGFIDRFNGYAYLTRSGLELALALDMARRKEREMRG